MRTFLDGSNSRTRCVRPFTGNDPRSAKPKAFPHRRMVSSDTRMRATPLVSPSMRLARFTVSPIAVYSRRASEPIRPTTAGPEWMPMPTSKSALEVAELALEGLQRIGHVERRRDRVPGVLGIVDRCAPAGHDRVADELVERAAVAKDHVHLLREIAVEQLDHLLRRARFRQRREAADVGEQQRHFAAFARAGQAALGHDLLDHVRIHEPAELAHGRFARSAFVHVVAQRSRQEERPREQQRRHHRHP